MNSKNKFAMVGSTLLLAALTQLSVGCSKADQANVAKVLNGSATMGPINLASCKVFQVNANGSRGTFELASAITNVKGEYSIPVGTNTGPVAVVCSGGTYRDEATGADINLLATDEVVAMVPDISQQSFASVNALSTIAYARASDKAAKGQDLATAISEAKVDIAVQFKLPAGFDILSVKPANYSEALPPNVSLAERQLGLAMATFSQVAKDKALTAAQVMALTRNMAEDYKDGLIDNKVAGVAMAVPAGFPTTYLPSDMVSGFAAAGTNFLNSSLNYSGSRNSPNPSIPAGSGGMIVSQ